MNSRSPHVDNSMSLKGNLQTFYIASILQLLYSDKKSGILRVASDDNMIDIIIKEGTIVYASGSQTESKLGNILINRDMISYEQLSKHLSISAKKGIALGKLLVAEKVLSQEALINVIKSQIEDLLYNLFMWKEGFFEFSEEVPDLDRIIVAPLDIMNLVLEASRRVDEMTVLREQIPNDSIIFKIAPNSKKKKEIKLSSDEWSILTLIDGKNSIKQLINLSGLEHYTVYKVLYSFLSSGLIEKTKLEENFEFYYPVARDYCEIINISYKFLKKELGKQADSILIDLKPVIVPKESDFFLSFDHQKTASENTHQIFECLKKSSHLNKIASFISENFDRFLFNIGSEVGELLGNKHVDALFNEIKEFFPYVQDYQDTDYKLNISANINSVFDQLKSKPEADKIEKQRGMFSLFNKG